MRLAEETKARTLAESAMPSVFVVLWSSAFVAGIFGTGAAPPLLLTFARFAIAGILLIGIARLVKAEWPRGAMFGHVAVSGLLMQAVQFGAFYSAIGFGLPGGVVALVQGLNPTVIALLARPVLGERIAPVQWAGFGIGAVGVTVAVVDQLHASVPGVLLCFVGLLGLSLGTIYQKRFVTGVDVRSATAVQFAVSAPVMGLATLLLETPEVHAWGQFSLALTWIVVVNSLGTFLLLNLMLRNQAANRVGMLFFLTPAVTALLTWLCNGQTLSWQAIIGLVLGAAGVLLASRRRS